MATIDDIRRCPDGTPVYVEDARQELFLAIRDLPLDQHEARIVTWLYGMDQPTMHAIATLITKAKANG